MYALHQILDDEPAFQNAVAARRAYKPLYVKIKLVYGCNLRCEMCNHWRERREKPLPIGEFITLLDELASLGCRKVHFSGGEPFLRLRLIELIEHTVELGMRATLTTNGTLIDKELAKRLVQSGLRGVNISIDSPVRKVHDRVRGVDGAWKKACKSVRYMRRYAHKGKVTVRINTVVSRSNYHTLVGIPDLADELGADALNLIGVDDHCGEQLTLNRTHIETYNREIAPQVAKRALSLGLIDEEAQAYPFGRTPAAIKRARRGEYAYGWYDRFPCFAPWTHSLVDYNGQVYVCCMTRERIQPLGDLRLNTFNEIWADEPYHRIRQMMFPPELKACRSCDDFLRENRQLLEMIKP
jgi:radical SAM protein with 4Fe4S-binding SPASM domain